MKLNRYVLITAILLFGTQSAHAVPSEADRLVGVGFQSAQAKVLATGDIKRNNGGETVSLQEATSASACMGTATANGTTAVTVSTTCATTGSRIFISATSDGTGSAANDQGACWTTNIVTGVSFDLDCPDANNNATYNWIIFHETP